MALGDVDGDGGVDLYFCGLEGGNVLYRNLGNWKFEDITAQAGVACPNQLSTGCAFADVDGDGDLDLLVNSLGGGTRIFLNDGDLDVVMNCLNAPARVFRNETSAPRLAVRLKGAGGNTRGIGAKITVTGGPVTQSQEMIAGGRYLSSDDPMRVFAAGDSQRLEIQVAWRSGRRSRVRDARPNCVYQIDEAFAEAPTASAPRPMRSFRGAPVADRGSIRAGLRRECRGLRRRRE